MKKDHSETLTDSGLVWAEQEILTQFEHKPFITLKELVVETHCPDAILIEGLKDLIGQGLVVAHDEGETPLAEAYFEKA